MTLRTEFLSFRDEEPGCCEGKKLLGTRGDGAARPRPRLLEGALLLARGHQEEGADRGRPGPEGQRVQRGPGTYS